MLTPLGRFLKKLRVDHNQNIKDMADKLCVSASFLSAVENGKKHMPSKWYNMICLLYKLDKNQMKDFTKAIAESETHIKINIENANHEQKMLAVSFARDFNSLNIEQIKKINNILQNK